MKIIQKASEMRQIAEEIRGAGEKIALVPTMGALHEGHQSLLREGRGRADHLVASIFVNPKQFPFNDRTDFEKYARPIEADLEICRKEKVDIVFTPTEEEIYPPGKKETPFPLPSVALPLEGVSRPGHFAGVIDVVSRLFWIVQPHLALFGEKDYQQLRVIEEMVLELEMGIVIVSCPTVRTAEGLALSSRNSRLSPEGIRHALALSRSLRLAQEIFHQRWRGQSERQAKVFREKVLEELRKDPQSRIDYVAVVDAHTLQEIERIEKKTLVAVATFVEGVRLIDNCILDADQVGRKTT